MKKILTILIISLLTLNLSSQTVKKEYYDYRQTQLMAQFQVNSVGEKHGWFKGYDKQGVLIAEYNFKNNLWEGLNKEYSTLSGSRQLTKSETYKAGVLNGPAIYYMDGNVVERKGNYINGEKDGKWYRIYSYSYDDIKRFHEIDGKLKDFVSSENIYSMGKVVNPESGEVREYFYPSKILRSILNYKESLKFGKNIWYYPTGAIETEELFEEKGHLVYSKTYYINGNLKESRTFVNNEEVYEGYNKDGTPTRAMENIQLKKQEEIKAKEDAIKAKIKVEKINRADSLLYKGYFDEAIKLYKEVNVNTSELEKFESFSNEYGTEKISFESFERQYNAMKMDLMSKNQYGYCKWIYSDLEAYYLKGLNRANEIMLAGYYDEAIIAYTRTGVSTEILKKFDENYQSYKKQKTTIYELQNEYNCCIRPYFKQLEFQRNYCDNVLKKEKGEIEDIGSFNDNIKKYFNSLDTILTLTKPSILVDANGKAIMKTTYPNGKDVYLKTKLVLDQYAKDYVFSKEPVEKEGFELKMKNLIELLSKIPESEWKDLNKQLKKVDDPEQIKAILKI
ncbi:MAG: hypothetical protein HYU68_00465 [Bacteroidetes bacterium]|nr:hypothetical protein [Bacteroidota bacterium]